MNSWKTAFQLTKFELKKSAINIMVTYLVTALFLAMFIKQMPSYLDNGTVLYDFLFLFVFGLSPLFPKPKSFEAQHIKNDFIASPIVVMQKQLPISHEVIINSRLIMHFFYTFPAQLLTLIILYSTTPLHNILTIGFFIAFATIWLSFSIYAGLVVPRFSIGVRGFWTTNSGIGIIILLLAILLFFILTLIHVFFENGIVYWSIEFAQDFPILTTGISIFLGIVGYQLWKRKMHKALQNISYA